MDIFDFIVNHQDEIEELEKADEGEILVDADGFDFSHSDIQFEVGKEDDDTGETIRFFVEAGKYRVVCEMAYDELLSNIDTLTQISDPDLRQKVVEAIENEIEPAASEELDLAKDEVTNAKDLLKEAEEKYNGVKDTLAKLKGEWGVP